jgi:hypothetical protein
MTATVPADWDHRDVEFVEAIGGKVHVVAHDGIPVEDGVPATGEAIVAFLMGATYTRCGRRLVKNRGGLEHSARGIDRFADERLCQKCVASVPEDQRWRLFEHPQPDDSTEDR